MTEKIQRGSTGLAVKAGFWYVVSKFLIKGIAFITTPIFARLMSAEDYGEFSNFASWQSTLFLISGAELYSTLSRAYYDYKEEYDNYISSITFLSFGITIIFYAIFLLCGDVVYKVVSIPPQYVHVMFCFLLFQSCKEIFMARERTLYRYKKVAALATVNLICPTVISAIMVVASKEAYHLSARIYGFYIPSAMVGVFCAISILRKARTISLEYWKYALKMSLPLMVHYLTAYLLSSSNIVVTKSILNAEAAAVVSIMTSAIHILTILLQAVSDAVTTWLMDNLEQKKYTELRKFLMIYVAGVCFVAFGIMCLGPEVIWILGGSKYVQAVGLLPGMIVAVTIQSVTTIFIIILTYKKQVTGAAICTAAIAGISIVIKISMLPGYGVEILPWINIFAYSALFVCEYVLVCRSGHRDIIDIKGFVGCIGILLVFMLACSYLYMNAAVRYGMIVGVAIIVLVFVYRKRELLIELLRKK